MGFGDFFERSVIYGSIGVIEHDAKKVVIERIIRENDIDGAQIVTFGDGPVEMRETRRQGGLGHRRVQRRGPSVWVQRGEAQAADPWRGATARARFDVSSLLRLLDRSGAMSDFMTNEENTMADNTGPITIAEMRSIRDAMVAEGKELVFTNGCF